MRLRPSLALIALLTCPLAARADFDQGYLPLEEGNEWVLRPAGGGAEQTVTVDQEATAGSWRFYRLRGFNGDARWVRQTAAGNVYGEDGARLYRLGASPGASWTFPAGPSGGDALPGAAGARVSVVSRSEAVSTPAGDFQGCLHLRFQPVGGVGLSDEWFAQGVGLVKRRLTTYGGQVELVLVRARVAGQDLPAASSGGGGIVSVLGGQAGAPFGISGDVPAARVRVRALLEQGLRRPTGMALHPVDGSLWIVDREADSTVVVDRPGQPDMRWRRFVDDSDHFNNNPMALAFSRTRVEFAAVLESVNDYNGQATPNYFTGPTLWTGDRAIFTGGAASHLDMLHHSPLAVGIAAGAPPASGPDRREYWVFNGNSGCIDRYFFGEPHELGGHDHADGITIRYGRGLRRVANVPGHIALDVASGQLYIADTGNGRLARLDTRTDLTGATQIQGYHTETPLYRAPGATIETLSAPGALEQPSGLILSGEHVVVSDHATGHVKVFTKDGALVGDADTGLGAGALTGLCETADGRLLALDVRGRRLIEVQVLPAP